MIRSLLESGLKQFQITVGHAGYFDSLAAGTGLDREQIEELKSLIRNRNSFGAERYLSGQNVPGDAAQAFIELPKLMGGPEILERARAMLSGMPEGAGGAFEALDRLEEVYDILKLYGLLRFRHAEQIPLLYRNHLPRLHVRSRGCDCQGRKI